MRSFFFILACSAMFGFQSAYAQLHMNVKREQVIHRLFDSSTVNVDSLISHGSDMLIAGVMLGEKNDRPAEIYCEFDKTDRLSYYQVTMQMDSTDYLGMLEDFKDQTDQALIGKETRGNHAIAMFRSPLCDERIDYFRKSGKTVIQRIRPGQTLPNVIE